jgi:EAL domain-containing protein (putative c-di-GMP-specific phosphodiesterase class I)
MAMNSDYLGFKRENFAARCAVFEVGDSGEAAYVIESGCVEVLVGTGDAQRRVAVLAEGAMFGEIALLDHQSRTATVRTLVPTRLVRIDRTHVEELLQRADPVVQYLMRLLLERFRNSNGRDSTTSSGTSPPALALPAPPDLHAAAVRTLSLAHDLSNAIDSNQLELYYQPIVSLPQQKLAGYESLVRWHHPSMGLISPVEFVPLAEKTGLIHRIGQWVLHRAVADWPALSQSLGNAAEEGFVSVNLSAPELCSDTIVDSVRAALSMHNMPAHALRIELTETAVIANMQTVARTLAQLQDLGVGIALDDFGTGYAGLDYLQQLPFSTLKIDMSFVMQMHNSQRSYQIIKSALELSRSLQLQSVAEGVEDAPTAALLSSMSCGFGQGYYFAKPMPMAAVSGWALAFGSVNSKA